MFRPSPYLRVRSYVNGLEVMFWIGPSKLFDLILSPSTAEYRMTEANKLVDHSPAEPASNASNYHR